MAHSATLGGLVLAIGLSITASAGAADPPVAGAVTAKDPLPSKESSTAKPPVGAQPSNGGALSFGTGSGPVEVTADGGLELDQTNKMYIARQNAVVKRGDRTLKGDVVTAYYRDIPNTNQTEIWRVVADGNVKLLTPTQEADGDHAVDDLLDTKVAVLTGQHLKLTTPQDVVTARDSLEWYDDKQLAVARGDALGIRADRRIRADILTAEVVTPKGQSSHISRMDAHGHVFVSRPDQTGTGDNGIYNVDTGIVTLKGHVALNRDQSTMVGEYGVMDLNSGVSHLTPAPDTRVQAYVIPKDHGETKPGASAESAKPGGNAPETSATASPSATAIIAPKSTNNDNATQKAQTDPAKPR